ncbi:DMT family transporter [Benzoatithermus flavus]|uniref:DMT family transporter n=1 Tax=Benzoatithermus flavus TaxID=3108223 RepID=A0ABU8XSW2_9PROT
MSSTTSILPIGGQQRATVLRPILLTLFAYASFTTMDTLVKLLSARFHPVQIACLVAAAGLLPPVLSALLRREPKRLESRAPGLQLLRGLLMLVGGIAAFMAYALLPLADAYTIAFTQPLIVIAFSVPLLGERPGWRRWAAVVAGFLGVLVMLRPGAGVFGAGALAAMVNAIGNGLALVLIRRAAARDAAEAFAFWGNAVIAAGSALALPWFWTTPSGLDLGLFLLAGLCSGTSFLVLATAYRLAPAAIVAPFQYSQMPYAILIGLLVFGDRPDPLALLGAVIVIASGLYVLLV